MLRVVILMAVIVLVAGCAPARAVTPPLPPRDPIKPPPDAATPLPPLPTQTSPASLPTLLLPPTQRSPTSTSPAVTPPTSTSPNPYAPQSGDSALRRGAAMLDSAQIVARDSLPAQYSLRLIGNLPTPCHQLRVEIGAPDAAGLINAQVYSLVDPGRMCVQVLAPFDVALRLDGYAPGKYTVLVNGAKAGEMVVAAARSMKGWELYGWQAEGGWYFSLLLGTNRNKSMAEITNPAARLAGVQALKDQLERLPAGEWVIAPTLPGLALPPDPLLAEIRAYCLARGLQFSAAAS